MQDESDRQPIPWIKWDFAQWLGGKVSRRPAIEQAVFINIQALMMRQGGPIVMDDAAILDMADRLHCGGPDHIESALARLATRGIIERDGDTVSIKFLIEQFAGINDTRANRAIAGAKGGKAKASKNLASAKQVLSKCLAKSSREEKSREEETREQYNTDTIDNVGAIKKRTRFTPPTIEEVTAYCAERSRLGNPLVDAQRFHSYYLSNGWRVGKNPMRDWQAAVRQWERNTSHQPQQASPQILRTQSVQQWEDTF